VYALQDNSTKRSLNATSTVKSEEGDKAAEDSDSPVYVLCYTFAIYHLKPFIFDSHIRKRHRRRLQNNALQKPCEAETNQPSDMLLTGSLEAVNSHLEKEQKKATFEKENANFCEGATQLSSYTEKIFTKETSAKGIEMKEKVIVQEASPMKSSMKKKVFIVFSSYPHSSDNPFRETFRTWVTYLMKRLVRDSNMPVPLKKINHWV
jgi:hypothetical protein